MRNLLARLVAYSDPFFDHWQIVKLVNGAAIVWVHRNHVLDHDPKLITVVLGDPFEFARVDGISQVEVVVRTKRWS